MGWREEEVSRKGSQSQKEGRVLRQKEEQVPLQGEHGSAAEDGEIEEGEGHGKLSAMAGAQAETCGERAGAGFAQKPGPSLKSFSLLLMWQTPH